MIAAPQRGRFRFPGNIFIGAPAARLGASTMIAVIDEFQHLIRELAGALAFPKPRCNAHASVINRTEAGSLLATSTRCIRHPR
jgi:hypothetical protein